MDLNKVHIIGNIAKDIEVKKISNGQSISKIIVATNKKWINKSGIKKELTEFHTVVLFGKLAEFAEKYLQKGKRVYVEGRLQTRSGETQDGKKRYKTEIIAGNLILLNKKS